MKQVTVQNPDFDKLKLTLVDIVEALCCYDVVHQDVPQFTMGKLFGLFDPGARKIYLNTQQDPTEMHDTIIHELYHAKSRRLGLRFTEDDVEYLTKRTLIELGYGEPE